MGGWSSSTLPGCHTRRYHGLLVAATNPPTGRTVLLSKLDETLVVNGHRYELGTNGYAGDSVNPTGYQYLYQFNKNLFPHWEYHAGGVILKKTVAMIHGENTVVLIYEVEEAEEEFRMEFLPLVSARDYHALQHANNRVNKNVQFENGIFSNCPYEGVPTFIFLSLVQPSNIVHSGIIILITRRKIIGGWITRKTCSITVTSV